MYIKKKLAQETPDPELFSVTNVPMYDKISSRRILADVPMSLAHHKLESIPEARAGYDDDNFGDAFWSSAYDRHSVRHDALAAGIPETNIRPVALYWDGVKYTNHDSFYGFYFRDLKSGQQFLAFLVRASLSEQAWVFLNFLVVEKTWGYSPRGM